MQTAPTKSAQAVQAASDAYALREFIGRDQLRMLRELVRETTEEHEHFRGILRTYITRIEAMPVEYKTDQEAPLAYLHYFKGNEDGKLLHLTVNNPATLLSGGHLIVGNVVILEGDAQKGWT